MRLSATKLGSIANSRSFGDQLADLAGQVPGLDLNFARNKSLIDDYSGTSLITFTRASTGTYVGSDGLVKTATTNEARFDHNPTTGESLGLLVEDARTNLLLNSATLSTQSVTVAAVANTLSFYGTGTVTLTGVSTAGPLVGTGVNNRVSLTFTPTAGVLVVTVSGSVTNAQLEAGAFATSYIPTTSATVTRAADVASITGSNFSSWYNQTEGTIFANYAERAFSVTHQVATVSNGTANERISLAINSSNTLDVGVISGGTDTFGGNTPTLTAQEYRIGFGYRADNSGVSANGSAITVDSAVTLPTVSQIDIGARAGSSQILNSTIKRFTYWPVRLPDPTLQSITSP